MSAFDPERTFAWFQTEEWSLESGRLMKPARREA
jgi:hypothetical protein